MKNISIFILCFLLCSNLKAQLYINSDITIQNGTTVFVDDTIQLASSSVVTTNGILQSTKSINTNGFVINTGTSGLIITPIASGIAKTFDIGTTSNNKIQIQHATGSAVVFQLAVRDSVYTNPITNTSYLTANVVNKRWYVAPQSSVSTLTGTAFWNAADESSGFLRSNCGVSYWQSGTSSTWSFTNGTSAATTTGLSPAYSKTATTTGLTAGIYYFGVGGFGGALPVTLLMFDATKNTTDDVLLKWITTSEINNDHFEIESSVDGSQFTEIAQVKGAGNSNSQINYLYKDETPFAKLNTSKLYYRLKQVDMDGYFIYTNSKEVDIEKVYANSSYFNISTYPNPATSFINIDIETTIAKNISITLFDGTGKNILNQNYAVDMGKQTYQVNTSQLASGIYLLNILDESTSTISKQKLIIY